MNFPLLLLYAVASVCASPLDHSAFTPLHLRQLKSRTKTLFRHGWHSYMTHGFPADEVRPISCVPYGPEYTSLGDIHRDVLGNVSLTVLDNLDLLILMGEWDELETTLDFLKTRQQGFFDQDHVVLVFEATIRWLGGLLLAHLSLSEVRWRASDGKMKILADSYDGFLLDMAYDLGLRLIPSYVTSSHLPLPRINLAKGVEGVPYSNNREACTAGATTPFLEFSLLLRLTGDTRFEHFTRRTFDKLWTARLPLGLLPVSLDPMGSKWLEGWTGIGALIDSFYEYALKGAILFDDNALLDVFHNSYRSLMLFLALKIGPNGWTSFLNIQTSNGSPFVAWIDALSAFWPGVQVLAGRLSDAVSSHVLFLKIWDMFDSIPERCDPSPCAVTPCSDEQKLSYGISLEWYPLRPEFIESTYYLYRATRDPMYLQIGIRVLHLFETRFKFQCGFAGYQDIRTGEMQDRMETFVLGELLKYLYLLFDEENDSFVHRDSMKSSNYIFSTEAHPLWLTKDMESRHQDRFKHRLSADEILATTLRHKSTFRSMWRGLLQARNELEPLDAALDDAGEPRFTHLLDVARPAFCHLSQCEVKPKQWTLSGQFLESGYYHWDQLFSVNMFVNTSFIRPPYMTAYKGNNDIELLQSFLDVYGMSSLKTCALPFSRMESEVQIGSYRRPEEYEMYIVYKTVDKYPFRVGDVVMPEFSGKVRVEHITENNANRYLDASEDLYVNKYDQTNIHQELGENEILSINYINGLQVSPQTILWSTAEYLGANIDAFKTTPEGHVYIMGKYVRNLRVYSDSGNGRQ